MKTLNNIKSLLFVCILCMFSMSASAQFVGIDSAKSLGGGLYRLTPNSTYENGYLWNQVVHDLNTPLIVEGKFNFGTKDAAGADGICFVMQNQCAGASVSGSGGNIGYKSFFGPSIAVEFDTYQNTGPLNGAQSYSDPNGDHIAVDIFGNLNHGSDSTIAGPVEIGLPGASGYPNVEDGLDHPFKIMYTQSDTTLKVYLDGILYINLKYNILKKIFAGAPYIYWGFTSSTGGSTNFQTVFIDDKFSSTTLKDATICNTPTQSSIFASLPPLTGYAGRNIALNKVSAASTEPRASKDAFNGAFGGASRWESVQGASADPSWIYVDLGSPYDLDSIVLYWQTAAAATYRIETADDGADLTNPASWTNRSSGSGWTNRKIFSITGSSGYKDVIKVATTNSRYVRMYGLTRTTGYGYSIYEFEVYGKPKYVWSTFPATADTTIKPNKYSASITVKPVVNTTYRVSIPDACLPTSIASFTATIDCPLPLTFLSFDVKNAGDSRLLTWVTTNEINTSYFIVEKSDGTGGFYPIARVSSANKSGVHSYSYNDATVLAGTAYYRIAQYDIDNKFDYSVTRSVTNTNSDLIVMPNPSSGVFILKGYSESDEEYDITIINAIGQIVLIKTVSPVTNLEVNLDISEYAAGTYILYATTSSKTFVKKIIKQ